MITKFKTIKNFGSFSSFDWDTTVRDQGNNIASFKSLNIIYGRNYSGKTTLSRVLRSYTNKKIHDDYQVAEFTIYDTGHGELCECDLEECSIQISVYNSDFVDDNLRLLRDKNGRIQPFAVVGSRNIEIEENIESLQKEIGDDRSGLLQQKNSALERYKEIQTKILSARNDLENRLKDKARSIKNNAIKYNVPTYNIATLRQDISAIAESDCALTPDLIEKLEMIIHEEVKDNIASFPVVVPCYSLLVEKTLEILETSISPSKSIQVLLDSPDLQNWAREGLKLHRGKSKICAFCSNPLSADFFETLDAHFNKESERLIVDLDLLISDVNVEIEKFQSPKELSSAIFYLELKSSYKAKSDYLNQQFEVYRQELFALRTALEARRNNIFKDIEFFPSVFDVELLVFAQNEINRIVSEHNELTYGIDNKKKQSRETLRRDAVMEFVVDIDYDKEVASIEKLESKLNDISKILKEFDLEIREKGEKIRLLKNELSDERKGAEQVNLYLQHYFGHESLSLASADDTQGSKFILLRGAEKASNLSEGECSLVAFCYFMAKLGELGANARDNIIWIDDPISSLDSNHVFFVFSLIENVLAQPKSYKQLFISTHNLDFLKYLKRITQNKNETQYFVLENDGFCSRLKLMPKHLKKYITEFNYLFNVIYRCTKEDTLREDYDYFYNFGNNLRKFLEAYLFYKYPNQDEIKNKLRVFFGNDNISTVVACRVDNEFSHLEEIFDRSTTPIDVPEMQKIARYVLGKIESVDKAQFDALVSSVQS